MDIFYFVKKNHKKVKTIKLITKWEKWEKMTVESPSVENQSLYHSIPVDSLIQDQQMLTLLNQHHITHFTDIQAAAIKSQLFFHQNMLVCTPSGSGKTLIALLANAHLLTKYRVNAIYLVPYKSLAQEKAIEFNSFFESVGIQTQAITSNSWSNPCTATRGVETFRSEHQPQAKREWKKLLKKQAGLYML